MRRITVGTVRISERAKELIAEVLSANRISGGKYVAELEKNIASYHGVSHAVAVNTGTAADEIALSVCYDFKADRGDEVIVPALTFVATVNAIIHAGFKPVFVDIDPRTYQIDPGKVEKAITRRTKVMMPVHLFGRPADMDPLVELAKKYNLFVIEDAAEAHGAEYKGKKVGTIGDMGAFSFYVAHIITTGEGGAIITDNEEYASLIRSLRAHGRACKCERCVLNIDSSYCPLRFKYGENIDTRFFFERIGFSGKMTEIEAALGIDQFEKLNEILAQRRSNLAYLNSHLAQYENFFQLFEDQPGERISPLCYPLLIKKGSPFTRKDIVNFLELHGIETRPMFNSIPTQQPAYRFMGYACGDFPHSEYVGENGFYIGVHQDLGKDDLDYVIESIETFVKKSRIGNKERMSKKEGVS